LTRPSDLPSFGSRFFTAHKGEVTTACFSADGRYAATGSTDTSLKVLDVERMKKNPPSSVVLPVEERPLIRTYYDHLDAVNDVLFHPNGRALVSCSDDGTIKVYDLQRVAVKKAFRQIQDSNPVKSISFHPSGDFILAGTTDSQVRLYDLQTLKCFLPANNTEGTHQGGICSVQFSPQGDFYVTSGEDGQIKIWNGVNGAAIHCIKAAHGDAAVTHVVISKTGQLLLSSGKDGIPRLWDIQSGKMVKEYATQTKDGPGAMRAVFTWDESFIMAVEGAAVTAWCSRTGKRYDRITAHSSPLRAVACSPIEDAMVTCGVDNKARFWVAEEEK
jgi:cleavage stimulation factor subunit 1